MATYYERNKERMLAYQRAYYAAHKERSKDYNAHYFQNVTKFVREAERPPCPPKKDSKPKTTIRYNSGAVTRKRKRIYKRKIKEPLPKPEVKLLPGILLDWNNL
jgi:hypothetical protein